MDRAISVAISFPVNHAICRAMGSRIILSLPACRVLSGRPAAHRSTAVCLYKMAPRLASGLHHCVAPCVPQISAFPNLAAGRRLAEAYLPRLPISFPPGAGSASPLRLVVVVVHATATSPSDPVAPCPSQPESTNEHRFSSCHCPTAAGLCLAGVVVEVGPAPFKSHADDRLPSNPAPWTQKLPPSFRSAPGGADGMPPP